MAAYYNEIDAYCAAWLRNLISAGHIPSGDVDERSIADAQPEDLRGYVQCHFFAGIGGWPYALRLAGWPDDQLAWTGSCPCQPISGAGKRRGHADERHLWPAFHGLIAECQPPTVIGEQVAGPDGREWLSGIRADLEALGCAVGAADLPAAGVGAPHIRSRIYWVADADRGRWNPRVNAVAGLGYRGPSIPGGRQLFWETFDRDEAEDGTIRRLAPGIQPLAHGVSARVGPDGATITPSRMEMLRAYGNAIVPALAAEFIQAVMECRP